MPATSFNPSQIQDLTGKVILVTGGTAGLGEASVIELVKHNAEHIYFTGRNATKASKIIKNIQSYAPDAKISFLELDLTSLSAVKTTAETFLSASTRLDVLMCNAGIAAVPPGLSKDGYEIQFAINHLGHAYLIDLLLPTLLQTANIPGASPRIVSMASMAYGAAPSKAGIRFDDLKTPMDMFMGRWIRYGQSKLANILYAKELARRYPQITTVSIHPGTNKTDMVDNFPLTDKLLVHLTNPFSLMSAEVGVYNQLWAATASRDDIVNGSFYEPVAKRTWRDTQEGHITNNVKLAEELWNWTQSVIEEHK